MELIKPTRRGFLFGLGALAAPAIIKTPGLLMPIKQEVMTLSGNKTIRLPVTGGPIWLKPGVYVLEVDLTYYEAKQVIQGVI